MATLYDVTVIAVRPGTHRQALAVLEKSLPKDPALLTSVTGAVTRFLHV